jgi:hypothetical protein
VAADGKEEKHRREKKKQETLTETPSRASSGLIRIEPPI